VNRRGTEGRGEKNLIGKFNGEALLNLERARERK
jgi:hypothetical protein